MRYQLQPLTHSYCLSVTKSAIFLREIPKNAMVLDGRHYPATWLHEYLYSIARSNGQTNSRSTQKMSAVLLVDRSDISVSELSSLVSELGFL